MPGTDQAGNHSLHFTVIWLDVVLRLSDGMDGPADTLVGCASNRGGYLFCNAFSVHLSGSPPTRCILRGGGLRTLVRCFLPSGSPTEHRCRRTSGLLSTTCRYRQGQHMGEEKAELTTQARSSSMVWPPIKPLNAIQSGSPPNHSPSQHTLPCKGTHDVLCRLGFR